MAREIEQIITALAVGIITGVFFSVLRQPIPAPSAFAGVSGIIGIWLGYVVVIWIKSKL